MKAKEFQQVYLKDLSSDDKKKEKRDILRERYPDKDKNQIKLQLSDDYMEKAKRVIQAERWGSIPFLAKKLLEDYLNRYDKVEERTELNERHIS